MERKGKSRVESLVSAGGVVYRKLDGQLETVLCGLRIPAVAGRPGKDGNKTSSGSRPETVRWSLAKGTPDEGETLEETALREVREETGLEVQLELPISSITYWFADRERSVRFHKTVHFYLMSAIGGGTELHDPEFDVVQWFPLDEALKVLVYPNETAVLRRAQELINQREGDD
jgi:8-oxo-dGTP pyrophosphatase MutT (NUDIX family)